MAARIMAPAGCPSCWARSARACTDRSTSATCWTATSVPPSIHASLYTAALDWLGADVEAVLGRRYDDVTLLRA